MFLNVEDQSIGVTKLEVYLPPKYVPVRREHLSPLAATDPNIANVWKDLAMEPECLGAFIRNQMEGRTETEGGDANEFVRRTGIEGIHIAEEESSSDMAVRIGKKIMTDCAPGAIDRVIFYHSTLAEYPVWSTPCRLQHELALRSIAALSISQKGGNAFALALKTGCEMLAAEPALRKILLVGSDKFIPPYDRTAGGVTAFGDSASAMLLERSTNYIQVLNVQIADYAEWWNPYEMDSNATEKMLDLMVEDAASMLRKGLEAVNASIDDLGLLLPPNLNRRFVEQLAKRCSLPLSRTYTGNLATKGSLLNSDMAVNFLGADQENLIPSGSLLAILGFGFGTSLSCTLMRRGPCELAPKQTPVKQSPVSLTHSSYYLPPNPITVEDYAEKAEFTAEQRQRYEEVHGLKTIHISRGATPADLALEACRKLFDRSGVSPDSIDALIIHHTAFILSFEPRTLVGELQHKLGLSRAVGFSLSGQACSTVIGALMVARNMIWTKTAKKVLVVGTDSFLGSQQARVIEDTTLLGEGASAVIVEASEGRTELTELCNFVSGAGYKVRNVDNTFQLSYFLGCIRVIREVLKRSSLSLDDIAMLVPHNINSSSWKNILPHIGCDPSKLFSKNIARRGHVCGSDLIINLTDVLEEGSVQQGDSTLLMTAGLGSGWGSAIVKI